MLGPKVAPVPHSASVGRFRLVAFLLGLPAAAAWLGACGSVRTELPASVAPAPPLDLAPTVTTTAETGPTSPPTTTSAFLSPGEKHPLPGGTLAALYPRVGVRPPKGVAPPPAGQAWAVVSVRFCAAPETAIDPGMVDPARFKVEVPGQGIIAAAPDAPALAKAPLTAANPGVGAGTCVEGSIPYLVAGEGHIESITYDTGAGLLRWAT